MKTARVKDFAFILVGLLTQYDQKESLREMKRGGHPNIYRIGHLLKAAQEAEDDAKHVGIWERDGGQAIADYRYILSKHFLFERGAWALSPLRQLDKQMGAWVASGKLPTYGKLRANPTKFVVRRGGLKEEYIQPDGTWGRYETSKRFSSQAAAEAFRARYFSGRNFGVFPVSRVRSNPAWMRVFG